VKPDGAFKLLSEVRDLEVVDRDGLICGICDDIELSGGPGGELRIKALLIGRGAAQKRMPRLLQRLAERSLGPGRFTRVPWSAVDHITSRIVLAERAEALGLRSVERRLGRVLKRIPGA
jgi:hypothetical protein